MTHLNNSAQTRFVVRVAKTANELKAILKVRYEILRVDFTMYTPENAAGIDIDQWDTQAHHLGLWKLSGGREEPIGFMRVILTEPLPIGKEVLKIVQEYPCLEQQSKRTSKNPIRFLEVFQHQKEARVKYDEFPSGKILEGSRLSVKKEYRDLNPGRFLVESSLALFYNNDLHSHGFMEVRENHLAAYYRYGFRPVASKYVPQDGCSHYLCYADYADLSSHLTGKLVALRQEYKRSGEITYVPQLDASHRSGIRLPGTALAASDLGKSNLPVMATVAGRHSIKMNPAQS